jgi:hypothetical protein
MKRLATASVLISIGAFGACAVEEPAPGGDPVAGAGNVPVQGGTSGTTSGTAGTGVGGAQGGTVTGGTAGVGVGGTPPTGGSAGALGGTAGDIGMGGMTGGTAGDIGMGGMTGGTAGDIGMGGMTGGTAGTAGVAGTAGTAGAPPCASVVDLFTADRRFDGRLVETPCADTNSDDCTGGGWRVNGGAITGCMNNRLDADQTIMVGGTPNQNYRVTLRVFGVVEPKSYGGNVTREAGNTRPTNNNDNNCTGTPQVCGANPPPWAYQNGAPNYRASDYNTYEIHVRNPAGTVACSYYLNSDTTEGHWTYSINYQRTINVIGGGSIRIRAFDQNCRMIKNCYDGGQGTAAQCGTRARDVNVSSVMPAPANLQQPGLGNTEDQAGQWLLIDVLSVSCEMPALACNGMPM